MPSPFAPKRAHSLSEDERGMVRYRFGSGVLPEDSLVSFDGNTLTIEHFDLERHLELNPGINIELIGHGRLSFPVTQDKC